MIGRRRVLAAEVQRLLLELDFVRRERDAYRQAATAQSERGDSLRDMCRVAQSEAVLAQRAEARAVRRARSAEGTAQTVLRRVERLQRAVARYRSEYAGRSRPQGQEAVR